MKFFAGILWQLELMVLLQYKVTTLSFHRVSMKFKSGRRAWSTRSEFPHLCPFGVSASVPRICKGID